MLNQEDAKQWYNPTKDFHRQWDEVQSQELRDRMVSFLILSCFQTRQQSLYLFLSLSEFKFKGSQFFAYHMIPEEKTNILK